MKLAKKLGYVFSDEKLFQLALTHRSYSKKNNERLEFLGDSILNFVIAEALYIKFPNAKEGELSRLRALLVKGVTLCEVARELGIGNYLLLGAGELKSGGFQRDSILADSVEAIIGAIYLDSNMRQARCFVLQQFASRLEKLTLDIITLKDSKTRLQEWLQAYKLPLPVYKQIKTEGEAHAFIFHVNCYIESEDIVTKGTGSSRRQAEQVAAERALIVLGKGRI